MTTFNTDSMVPQRFPFPAPIMHYILINAQPQHLLKLYQCAKFFYAKYGVGIIENLEIVDDDGEEMFHPHKTIIRLSNPAIKKLIDFWISDSVIYRARLNLDMMPYFSHCTIKKLEACNFLVWREYEALTKAGTIKELKIGNIYRDLELVPVEELIAAVPNATSIEIRESKITPTTFESLAALNHQVKISNFVLGNMTLHVISVDQMEKFLINHVDVDCNVRFSLKLMPGDFDWIREINERLKKIENNYNEIVALILHQQQMMIKNEIALNEKKIMEHNRVMNRITYVCTCVAWFFSTVFLVLLLYRLFAA